MKTLTLSDVAASSVTFDWRGRALIVTPEHMDTLTFWDRFGHEAQRTAHSYGLDDYGRFFVFYVADCFDPPLAVIRAESWETAYEVFCDEFSDWIAIREADMRDYDESRINYNSSGIAIDTESVMGDELRLVSIQVSDVVATEAK